MSQCLAVIRHFDKNKPINGLYKFEAIIDFTYVFINQMPPLKMADETSEQLSVPQWDFITLYS